MAASRKPTRQPVVFSLLLGLLLLAEAFSPSTGHGTSLSRQVAGEIRLILEQTSVPKIVLGRETILNADLLPGFYIVRGCLPLWVDDLGLTEAALELLDLLRGADEEGLCPEDYHLAQIEPLVELEADCRRYCILFAPHYMARLDLLLTDAFLLYASHQIEGRVDPAEVHEGWRARPRQVDLVRILNEALGSGQVFPLLTALAPPHRGYLLLRDELERYRRISAAGGWPSVPAGRTLHSGDRDPRLLLLRQRLLITGDLAEEEAAELSGELFDPATEAALVRFQGRHGLDEDGVLGARTLEELNVPVEDRIRQIEVNLERWRWLPKDLGKRHLLVNIADFRLEMVEDEVTVLSMPVVVGTSFRKTPVFSARLSYLVLAPYWNVPPTILREDKLPLIKADPRYLRRHHFEIVRWGDEDRTVDYRQISWKQLTADTFPGLLRQQPGPWNPLGKIKFMFPNSFGVYLHDTPDKELFGRDARTFSSGCIRIQRPIDLAQYLLEGEGWDCGLLLDALERRSPLRVDLRRSLPVHILYWTAWVDAEGRLQFRRDVYLRDLDLELALDRRRTEPERRPQSGLPKEAPVGG